MKPYYFLVKLKVCNTINKNRDNIEAKLFDLNKPKILEEIVTFLLEIFIFLLMINTKTPKE